MEAPLDALLERSAWTRALAKRLVADAHEADDLVQQTWLAAIERPPARGVPIARWIAAVMRNLARQHRREDSRRTQREHVAARAEVDLSHDGLAERLETHRALVAAVAALGATSRSAILMRYFEGLSPREISRRTGEPVRTVHTRLHRALHELREKLDHEHGDNRGAWLLTLAPLANAPHGTVAWLGVAIVDAKLKVACAALVVIGAATFFALRPTGAVAPQSRAAELENESLVAADVERATDAAASAGDRLEVPANAAISSPPAVEVASETPTAMHGRVLDATGAALAGVLVHWSPFGGGTSIEATAPSASDGRFEIPLPGGGGTLESSDPRYTAVLSPWITDPKGAGEHVLVVAPRVRLAGRVVDAAHNELESATVTVSLPQNFRSRFDSSLDSSSDVRCEIRTNAHGEFALDAAPAIEGATLAARLAGYLGAQIEIPQVDTFDIELVLKPNQDLTELLSGTVVDGAGTTVEGAHVALGDASTATDAHGRFTLLLVKAGDASVVRAVRTGFLPGEVKRMVEASAKRAAWPDPLVIHLGGPALSIVGRVVDADDEPVADAEVWSEDKSEFGHVEQRVSNFVMRLDVSIEQLVRGEERFERRIRTDAEGRFKLEGLLAKPYSLCALRSATLDFVNTVPIEAGAKDVVIRLPRIERRPRVAGRVVSRSGAPVAATSVEVRMRGELMSNPRGPLDLRGITVTTDGDGRFEMRDVPRSAHALYVTGSTCVGKQFELAANADFEHLELVVALECRAKIELLDAGREATSAQLLDGDGNELACQVYHGNLSMSSNLVVLTDGRSEVFTVTEDARTLVLRGPSGAFEEAADGNFYATHRDIARRQIRLVPGDVNVIR